MNLESQHACTIHACFAPLLAGPPFACPVLSPCFSTCQTSLAPACLLSGPSLLASDRAGAPSRDCHVRVLQRQFGYGGPPPVKAYTCCCASFHAPHDSDLEITCMTLTGV